MSDREYSRPLGYRGIAPDSVEIIEVRLFKELKFEA